MNEAVLKKEEEEKKKKEEERSMRAGTQFGQPRQAEPAAKKPAAPFAPEMKKAEETKKLAEEKNQACIFQGLRNAPFGDELMRGSREVEDRARAEYEKAVAREKEAIVKGGARKVVVKREGGEEKGKAKEGKKGNWEKKGDGGENGKKK